MLSILYLSCSSSELIPPTPICQDNEELFFTSVFEDISEPRELNSPYHNEGPQVAIFDMDNDGSMEIFQCFPNENTYIYTLKGKKKFSNRCGFMLVDDLNNDGWMDLVVDESLGSMEDGKITIYKNQRGRLKDIYSLQIGDDYAKSILTGDFNKDGHLDLFILKNAVQDDMSDRDIIAMRTAPFEYQIRENLLTANISSRKGFDAGVGDFNQDGLSDIYVANDRGYEFGGNTLWLQTEQGFEVANDCFCDPIQSSMGMDIYDYNHDGYLDILTGDVARNYLFEGMGDGNFIDTTMSTGANPMEDFEMSWGLRFVDIDNNGQTELFIAQGDHTYEGNPYPEYEGEMGLSVLERNEQNRFEEVQSKWGFDQMGSFRSIVPFNWNNDGVLDYWITDVEKPAQLMASNGCSNGNWLYITGPSGTAVRFTSDSKDYYGEIRSSSSYAASTTPFLHFGLGDIENIDVIEVQFRGKSWQTYEENLKLPTSIHLTK